jgi:hypothetical protein
MTAYDFIDASYSEYLSDRPVGFVGDLLWRDRKKTIALEIEHIAQRIVSPLRGNTKRLDAPISNSMTFGVYGRWGMGKSSALRMLKEAAEQEAGRTDGGTKDVSERLKICEYIASAYEPFAKEMDARITLALRIFTTLAGSPREAIQAWAEEAFAIGERAFPEDSTTAIAGSSAILEEMARTLSRLIDFDKILQKKMRGSNDESCVLLVLIDDLDRCSTDFVWQILNFIQQLSDVPNLFFVLAIEEEHLKKTIEEHSLHIDNVRIDPDFASEKYIQHSVTVPDMEDEDLKHFITKLMTGSTGNSDDPNGVIATLYTENVQFIQLGLRAMEGERVLTPRSVKRCLNAIGLDLRIRLATARTSQERQKILKERILQYVWRPFYKEYFLLARNQNDKKDRRQVFEELERACRRFATDGDDDMLNFELRNISARYGPMWGAKLNLAETVNRSLARYLGMPPYWFQKADEEAEEPAVGFLSLEDQFQNLYVHSEAAEASANRKDTLIYARQILNLILANGDHFTQRHAALVGNTAINAERFDEIELATALYELALKLDPGHSHNIQNYLDFIVKKRVENLYERAQELIVTLKQGKHAAYRLDRTLALEAQLNEQEGRGASIDPETVEQVVQGFLRAPTNRRSFVSVMSLLAAIGNFQRMDEVAKNSYRAARDENQRYLTLRGLADALAASPDERNEKEAMDLYRYILEHYPAPLLGADLPDIQHNYASLLYKHDYDDKAGELWYEAYNAKKENSGIRRAYSLYLIRARRPDLASLATEGDEVSEKVLQPAVKDMPERFLDEDIDRWWEDRSVPAE